jgi:hypothetical protein
MTVTQSIQIQFKPLFSPWFREAGRSIESGRKRNRNRGAASRHHLGGHRYRIFTSAPFAADA